MNAVESTAAPRVTETDESWWHILRVSGCRVLVTMVTTLMCLPVAALALGWKPAVVVSGSMEPALSRGDVVAVRSVAAADVGGGAVIAFNDATHGGRLTTHRAVQRKDGDSYVTKGDANRTPDSMLVTPDKLKGVVSAVVPWVGSAWLWLQEGDWHWLILAVLLYGAALRGCLEGPPGGKRRAARTAPEH
ncbi:signal peptidase I [Streptomyces eurocidicus]|uniref:Signal peptidase I n=1 Tax=Streptomyces eurocidicus TaxID=66423 RepID=A0A7W8BGZ3_STREU|nr:signal peptidase I [Streptomyces eurocidicus]MBB5121768.1 signal peptidase [Streptomyces eurocidicus]MBF6055036.1 signal peptidase I [Streptomyces eurocidicus]